MVATIQRRTQKELLYGGLIRRYTNGQRVALAGQGDVIKLRYRPMRVQQSREPEEPFPAA